MVRNTSKTDSKTQREASLDLLTRDQRFAIGRFIAGNDRAVRRP